MASGTVLGPHAATALELKAQILAEREGRSPFLIYRDGSGEHRLRLDVQQERVTIGRRLSADVALESDEEVSRLHAELVRKGEDWTLADEGLSMNGSFVNGEPVRGHRRLRDGDAIRVGGTVRVFRIRPTNSKATTPSDELRTIVNLSDAQRRVLAALCRPFRESVAFATPPSNEQIAAELYLSVDAVKKHLRTLFEKFGVSHLPQNEKRARLVERAFAGGFISEQELRVDPGGLERHLAGPSRSLGLLGRAGPASETGRTGNTAPGGSMRPFRWTFPHLGGNRSVLRHRLDRIRLAHPARITGPDQTDGAIAMNAPSSSGPPRTNPCARRGRRAMSAVLLASATSASAAPRNDDFGDAPALRVGKDVKGNINGATNQRGEPRHANSLATRSVWYRFRPKSKVTILLGTCSSSFDSVVAVDPAVG